MILVRTAVLGFVLGLSAAVAWAQDAAPTVGPQGPLPAAPFVTEPVVVIAVGALLLVAVTAILTLGRESGTDTRQRPSS